MPEDPEEVASCFECCPSKDLLASYVNLRVNWTYSLFTKLYAVFRYYCIETEDISISGLGPVFYQQ